MNVLSSSTQLESTFHSQKLKLSITLLFSLLIWVSARLICMFELKKCLYQTGRCSEKSCQQKVENPIFFFFGGLFFKYFVPFRVVYPLFCVLAAYSFSFSLIFRLLIIAAVYFSVRVKFEQFCSFYHLFITDCRCSILLNSSCVFIQICIRSRKKFSRQKRKTVVEKIMKKTG